ncbi:MAG TPA: branched-chain amino acid ABC transporter permease [Hypericibacter adhaerens]|uniref:branched-chain amino acid ABC transporter permease n=1 Tax=Hypericibacter adhaerens TaxID=2602016 RepID=UPI002CD7E74A|nr:branched-chain amino acid ABC transporter permease [Hypericibacter adhaerens]HWA44153.1 branched-chain amino acid ABC transporter permease [Hypericibacter adhaerens]
MIQRLYASTFSLARYPLLLAALLLIEPVFSSQYLIRIVNTMLIQAVAALGVNVVLGFAGLVSIAHAALMALGAYTSALLMLKLGMPFPIAFVTACLFCGIVSGFVGLLGNRVETNYLLVITLGIHVAIFLVIVNENWLTGGASGLFNVPKVEIGPWRLANDRSYYWLTAPVFVAALYFAERLRHSKPGRAMIAARLHAPAARMSGINVNRYRVWAMVFAGVYFGASGSLFAHLIGFLGPEDFSLSLTLLLTLTVVVGGLGSNVAACVSLVILTAIAEAFQQAASSWLLFYGILIMVVMVVAPRGMAGVAESIVERIKRARSLVRRPLDRPSL